MQRFSQQLLRIGLVMTTAAFLSSSGCPYGTSGVSFSTAGGSPSRFHNAVRVEHASQNLADAVEAQCGAGNSKAAAAATQAQAAAQNIEAAIDAFNDTPSAADRVTNAVAQAHKANEAAYNQYLACGGTPKSTDPRIPGYSETFWDISS